VERLDFGVLLWLGLLDGRRLALRDRLSRCIWDNGFGSLGDGLACVDIGYGGEAAGEEGGPYGYDAVLARLNCCCGGGEGGRTGPPGGQTCKGACAGHNGVVWSGVQSVGCSGRVAVTVLRSSKFLGPRSSGEPITRRLKSATRSGHPGPTTPDPPQTSVS
jgi:hypothetical protein